MAKTNKAKHNDAVLEIAERAFREALKGGDSFADAVLYGQLMAESAELAAE